MKKLYNSPELIVNQFKSVDVITVSIADSKKDGIQGIYTTNSRTTYTQLQ